MTRLAGLASKVFCGFTLLRDGLLFLLSGSEAPMDHHQRKDGNPTGCDLLTTSSRLHNQTPQLQGGRFPQRWMWTALSLSIFRIRAC
jgi:hypothetical protein